MVLIVVFLGLAIGPLLILGPRAAKLSNDQAYQSLSAIVLAHNGDPTYNTAAAKAERAATSTPAAGGAATYRLRDQAGTCWSVTVPDAGHASQLPVEVPSSYCP